MSERSFSSSNSRLITTAPFSAKENEMELIGREFGIGEGLGDKGALTGEEEISILRAKRFQFS